MRGHPSFHAWITLAVPTPRTTRRKPLIMGYNFNTGRGSAIRWMALVFRIPCAMAGRREVESQNDQRNEERVKQVLLRMTRIRLRRTRLAKAYCRIQSGCAASRLRWQSIRGAIHWKCSQRDQSHQDVGRMRYRVMIEQDEGRMKMVSLLQKCPHFPAAFRKAARAPRRSTMSKRPSRPTWRVWTIMVIPFRPRSPRRSWRSIRESTPMRVGPRRGDRVGKVRVSI